MSLIIYSLPRTDGCAPVHLCTAVLFYFSHFLKGTKKRMKQKEDRSRQRRWNMTGEVSLEPITKSSQNVPRQNETRCTVSHRANKSSAIPITK
jgi:hypothetical protein